LREKPLAEKLKLRGFAATVDALETEERSRQAAIIASRSRRLANQRQRFPAIGGAAQTEGTHAEDS
jgi:hypothetical protein